MMTILAALFSSRLFVSDETRHPGRSGIRHLITFLSVSVIVGISTTGYADTKVAICKSPTGWRVDYGVVADPMGKKNVEPKVSEDGISGATLTYVLDSENPDFMIEIFEPVLPAGVSESANPKTVDKHRIVFTTETQVTAIAVSSVRVETITLYPKLGFLIVNRASHYRGSNNAIGSTLFARCKMV